MKNIVLLLSLSALFILGGCAEAELVSHVAKQIPGVSSSQSKGTFKVGSPYKIAGKYYRPQESYTLVETGIASWYGPNFHGKKTANGEYFNQNELTAAHRTLQLPSLVRVTNLDNGRSLIVRVNDRGPFSKGRIIDVSKRAAELLDFKIKGTAKVRLEVLGPESRAIAEAAKRGESTRGVEVAMNERPSAGAGKRTAPTPSPSQQPTYQQASYEPVSEGRSVKPVERVVLDDVQGHKVDGDFYPDPIVKNVAVPKTNIYVQAASFTDQARADNMAAKLSTFGRATVYPALVNGRQYYRVRFPSGDVATADRILNNLDSAGYADALIVVE